MTETEATLLNTLFLPVVREKGIDLQKCRFSGTERCFKFAVFWDTRSRATTHYSSRGRPLCARHAVALMLERAGCVYEAARMREQ